MITYLPYFKKYGKQNKLSTVDGTQNDLPTVKTILR